MLVQLLSDNYFFVHMGSAFVRMSITTTKRISPTATSSHSVQATQHGPSHANLQALKQELPQQTLCAKLARNRTLNNLYRRLRPWHRQRVAGLRARGVRDASLRSTDRAPRSSRVNFHGVTTEYRLQMLFEHVRIMADTLARVGRAGTSRVLTYARTLSACLFTNGVNVNRIRDGLVYAIMSNIRGEYNFGPECFLSATSADLDSDTDTETTARRDMRELVPLRLNRPWLLATSKDIQLRLQVLCKEQAHTAEYADILDMIQMLERLGSMDEDNPKLELSEYREIFITLRDGLRAGDELPSRLISVRERPSIQNVQFSAECVWGVAVLNSALRRLEGSKLASQEEEEVEGGYVDGDGGAGNTFEGDLQALSGKINGLLLDSKDNFPEGEKWFGREDEVRILETVVRVAKEAGKRRGW